jgi:hypothetical protein|nr:MAG TPA: zinc ribbon domain protein [Caudoviricetes sp.]
MEKYYEGKLRCITCAGEDFEFNEDKSYVKCTTCGREYLGGYDELLQYNQDVQDEVMNRMKKDAEEMVRSEFEKAFKGLKNITLK